MLNEEDIWFYLGNWILYGLLLINERGGVKMEIINQLEGRIEVDFLASENIAYLIYSLISVSYLKLHKTIFTWYCNFSTSTEL